MRRIGPANDWLVSAEALDSVRSGATERTGKAAGVFNDYGNNSMSEDQQRAYEYLLQTCKYFMDCITDGTVQVFEDPLEYGVSQTACEMMEAAIKNVLESFSNE